MSSMYVHYFSVRNICKEYCSFHIALYEYTERIHFLTHVKSRDDTVKLF